MCKSGMIILLAMSLSVGTCHKKEASNRSKGVVPQAKPVLILLNAAKAGDIKLMKTAFSVRMQTKLDENGWDGLLKTYQDSFKKEFGDYKVDDFTFIYTGTETEGQVSVVHKEKELPGLYVIKEKADWKLSEI